MVGLTDCVPPFGWSVYLLPSVPATVTCAAFAAVTVRVAETPEAIETGLAVMPTVAVAGNLDKMMGALPAHPAIRTAKGIQNTGTNEYRNLLNSRGSCFFIAYFHCTPDEQWSNLLR